MRRCGASASGSRMPTCTRLPRIRSDQGACRPSRAIRGRTYARPPGQSVVPSAEAIRRRASKLRRANEILKTSAAFSPQRSSTARPSSPRGPGRGGRRLHRCPLSCVNFLAGVDLVATCPVPTKQSTAVSVWRPVGENLSVLPGGRCCDRRIHPVFTERERAQVPWLVLSLISGNIKPKLHERRYSGSSRSRSPEAARLGGTSPWYGAILAR